MDLKILFFQYFQTTWIPIFIEFDYSIENKWIGVEWWIIGHQKFHGIVYVTNIRKKIYTKISSTEYS